MTDARMPERWLSDRRFLRLSDAGHRLYVTALLWSVANRSDGVVHADDLALLVAVDPACAAELEKAGLWASDRDTWVIADYAATQTSRDELEVLENARRRDREKKARQRGRPAVPGDGPPGSPPVRVPGTAQDRQDRQEGRQGAPRGERPTDLQEIA